MFYTKIERLNIVLDITKKLKFYKNKNGISVNLYDENNCSFNILFKKICNDYIKQDENNIVDFTGTLKFEEIDKNIEYILPARRNTQPLFVIRYK